MPDIIHAHVDPRIHVLRLLCWLLPGIALSAASWITLVTLVAEETSPGAVAVAFGCLQALAFAYCMACCAVYIAFDLKARVLQERALQMDALRQFLSQHHIEVSPYNTEVPASGERQSLRKGAADNPLSSAPGSLSYLNSVALDAEEEQKQRQRGHDDAMVKVFTKIQRFRGQYEQRAQLLDYKKFIELLRQLAVADLKSSDSRLPEEVRQLVDQVKTQAQKQREEERERTSHYAKSTRAHDGSIGTTVYTRPPSLFSFPTPVVRHVSSTTTSSSSSSPQQES